MDNLMCDFQRARFSAGFNSRRSVSDYLQVNISTVNRWENNETKAPFSVFELLRLLSGLLPDIGRRGDWSGWRFVDEFIYTPEGTRYTAADIEELFYLRQRIRFYRADIRRLEDEIKSLKNAVNPKNSNIIQFPTSSKPSKQG